MKLLLITVILQAIIQSISCIDLEWEAFKLKYNKHYDSFAEEEYRHEVFNENKYIITKHNDLFWRRRSTFTMGINQFADLTSDEFQRWILAKPLNVPPTNHNQHRPNRTDVPYSIDWRTHGYVTPVKDQGQCGGCWAFSATGSLEGQHFAKSGTLTSLSEQQLIDCSLQYGNFGCGGGDMDNAFQYIKDNGGIESEEDYRYKGRQQPCHYNSSAIAATCTGYVDVPSGDEGSLQQNVGTIGPVSVAVDSSQISFQFYTSGVYYEPNCSTSFVNHGMLVVGYDNDVESGLDYWIVKNSWGKTWGEAGYINMARNMNDNCCIACLASYPTV